MAPRTQSSISGGRAEGTCVAASPSAAELIMNSTLVEPTNTGRLPARQFHVNTNCACV